MPGLSSVWPSGHPLIGMVHLLPLPGSPRWGGSMHRVLDRAEADANALAKAGFDGVIVENFGDVPFFPDVVPP
ncbi:MAG: phosphorybosylanthranilate isomerase, partial [Gemmatimonadales bacterium]|nr:phosphorybosylanthranilate isomerase [Gemmatimonadales bacterium]